MAAMKILEQQGYKTCGLLINLNSKLDKLSKMYINDQLKNKAIKVITLKDIFEKPFK